MILCAAGTHTVAVIPFPEIADNRSDYHLLLTKSSYICLNRSDYHYHLWSYPLLTGSYPPCPPKVCIPNYSVINVNSVKCFGRSIVGPIRRLPQIFSAIDLAVSESISFEEKKSTLAYYSKNESEFGNENFARSETAQIECALKFSAQLAVSLCWFENGYTHAHTHTQTDNTPKVL